MATTNHVPSASQQQHVPMSTAGAFIRTLVVDDTQEMVQTISAILSQNPWVHVAGTADNGLTAIKQALVHAPDLIVMDLNMPVMNGLRAATHIKQRLPETKIIIVSSDDDPEVAFAAMDCGADGFIPKAKLAKRADWQIRRLFGDRDLLKFGT